MLQDGAVQGSTLATRDSAMPDTLVLRDFVLIDGTGRAPAAGSSVVVEDGHIVAVGDDRRRPVGTRVIDGSRGWLLPGLWDSHIHHVFAGGGFVWAEEFSDQQREWSWRGCLRSGVTSVVSVGDDKEVILSARAREADGSLLAPRVFASGTIFAAPGGHPCSTILHGHRRTSVGWRSRSTTRSTAATACAALSTTTTSILSRSSTAPSLATSLASIQSVLSALVEESHERGRPIVAHVSTPEEAAECVAAGVDGLEHMVFGHRRGTRFGVRRRC